MLDIIIDIWKNRKKRLLRKKIDHVLEGKALISKGKLNSLISNLQNVISQEKDSLGFAKEFYGDVFTKMGLHSSSGDKIETLKGVSVDESEKGERVVEDLFVELSSRTSDDIIEKDIARLKNLLVLKNERHMLN